MGGVFSKPKPPPAPTAQVNELTERQRVANENREAKNARQLASRSRARRGGARQLMSQARPDASLGVTAPGDEYLGQTRRPGRAV